MPNEDRVPEMVEGCGNCRFWLDLDDDWSGSGVCRRWPPKEGTDSSRPWVGFPVVRSSKWCGEYSPLTAAKEPV